MTTVRSVVMRLTYAALAAGLVAIVVGGSANIAADRKAFSGDPVCRRTIDLRIPEFRGGSFCTILPGAVVGNVRGGKYGDTESLTVDDARGERYDVDLDFDWCSQRTRGRPIPRKWSARSSRPDSLPRRSAVRPACNA